MIGQEFVFKKARPCVCGENITSRKPLIYKGTDFKGLYGLIGTFSRFLIVGYRLPRVFVS